MQILSMRISFSVIIWIAVCFFSGAAELEFAVRNHSAAEKLLEKNPIHLEASGRVAVPFEDACRILEREDFLEAIQKGYAQTLPEGETPEFAVQCLPDGAYHYVNRKGEETAIEEVTRSVKAGESVTLVIYSEGRRFFGPFQSLCVISVFPSEKGDAEYSLEVYARPESAALRLFARLAPVELFFRHKTRHLTELVVDVCEQILAPSFETGQVAIHEYSNTY